MEQKRCKPLSSSQFGCVDVLKGERAAHIQPHCTGHCTITLAQLKSKTTDPSIVNGAMLGLGAVLQRNSGDRGMATLVDPTCRASQRGAQDGQGIHATYLSVWPAL